jgi:hypothetical protein
MNDFTKEELESMVSMVSRGEVYTEFGSSWTTKANKPIIEKLQSMIDNYCEHLHKIECADCEVLRCGHCERAQRK